LGRQETMLKRLEMAHFIAMMRAQEADDDEFIYWQSHPWARMKRVMTIMTIRVCAAAV
jgi:hypothetical protein